MLPEIKNRIPIEQPLVVAAAANWGIWREQLARVFSQSWTRLAHLPVSLEEAREKVNAFRPNTFVLIDRAEPETILAQVHTAPITISHSGRDGVLELIDKYGTYNQVVSAGTVPADPGLNALVCFSVNSRDDGAKIATPDGGLMPKSIWIITHLPVDNRVRIIPYSFMLGQSFNFFLEKIDQPLALGPIGLHRHKGKAQIFALLENSRPEHAGAFGNNTLAVYPKNNQEAADWRELDSKWKSSGKIETEVRIKPGGARNILVSDMINRVFL